MAIEPRAEAIEEMLEIYLAKPPERMVKAYLRHVRDIDTETLRAAVAGCIEHGQGGHRPTPFDIRRRAMDLQREQRERAEWREQRPRQRECRKRVHRTAVGSLLCCREEAHWGDCEPWFDARGAQPNDGLIVSKLIDIEPRDSLLRAPER